MRPDQSALARDVRPAQVCRSCGHHFACHSSGGCDAGVWEGHRARIACDCTVPRREIESAFRATLDPDRIAEMDRAFLARMVRR